MKNLTEFFEHYGILLFIIDFTIVYLALLLSVYLIACILYDKYYRWIPMWVFLIPVLNLISIIILAIQCKLQDKKHNQW